MMVSPTSNPNTPNESKQHKRMEISRDAEKYSYTSSPRSINNETKRQKTRVFLGISDLQNLDFDRCGSVGKDIKEHMERRVRKCGSLSINSSLLSKMLVDAEEKLSKQDSKLANRQTHHNVIDLEDDCVAVDFPVIVLSDDEDERDRKPSYPVREVLMQPSDGQFLTKDTMVGSLAERSIQIEEKDSLASESEIVLQIRGNGSLASEAERTIHMEEGESLATEAERTIQIEGKEHLACEAERSIQMEEEESLATEAERMIQMEGKEHLASEAERTIHMEEVESLDTEAERMIQMEGKEHLTAEAERTIQMEEEEGLAAEAETTIQMEERQSLATDAKRTIQMEEKESLANEVDIKKDKGIYVGAEEDGNNQTMTKDDGLQDIWQELKMALECSKDVAERNSSDEHMEEDEEDCDHSYVLKDDLGYVCRICGLIGRGIETIIEVQFNKAKRSNRTYMYEPRNVKGRDSNNVDGVKLSEDDIMVTDICPHPRHTRQMKPHQVEGFNFLLSNLVTDHPGGCILAHAPGSGKTFMIISFMQSFLAKYPQARPLVVLPKGILATWKKEFQHWQIEDIPLFDFYAVKADSRAQKLDVLKKWVEQKSILFLGYKQFSSTICDSETSKTAAACREILLKQPSILILDEGHTPRNENTDVLQSLAKIQTPRKVVLSGTLYQNHVKEVFNILNLVRPKFLKLDTPSSIVKRIMSRVHIPGLRKQFKTGGHAAFYELVEHCLLKDEDFKRKVTVIQDLREMTSKVLHYYKGDFLDELPGLIDFTVVLNLSSRQKSEVSKLKMTCGKGGKFKLSAVGSSVLLHPKLNSLPVNSVPTDEKMDDILENLDVKEGVKAKFFLNMLNLCESSSERLLVFGQYLQPLKFLERLVVKMKGWSPGREIFVISGESNAEHREWSMERFNNSPHSRVFFGSIKACGEGISLVGASRIIILDIHLNPSVTRQAIGRAFRPGQTKKVYAYRLVSAETHEEGDHTTCFKKELISRMWFEWNEYCGYRNFEIETVDVNDCCDPFLESPLLREDIRTLHRR